MHCINGVLFVFQFFLELIAVVTLVAIVNYWLLFPTLLMSLLFYVLRHIYINTARSIKRLEALSEYTRFNGGYGALAGAAFKARKFQRD